MQICGFETHLLPKSSPLQVICFTLLLKKIRHFLPKPTLHHFFLCCKRQFLSKTKGDYHFQNHIFRKKLARTCYLFKNIYWILIIGRLDKLFVFTQFIFNQPISDSTCSFNTPIRIHKHQNLAPLLFTAFSILV